MIAFIYLFFIYGLTFSLMGLFFRPDIEKPSQSISVITLRFMFIILNLGMAMPRIFYLCQKIFFMVESPFIFVLYIGLILLCYMLAALIFNYSMFFALKTQPYVSIKKAIAVTLLGIVFWYGALINLKVPVEMLLPYPLIPNYHPF